MNPTGILFIRQAGREGPASQADPASLSSLGIWHRNFNRRATQAGRSVQETNCACQSELTNWREHSKVAALLAWQSVTSVEEEKEDEEGMKASGKAVGKGSRGTTLRDWAAIQVRGEQRMECQGYKDLVAIMLLILIKQVGFLLIAFLFMLTPTLIVKKLVNRNLRLKMLPVDISLRKQNKLCFMSPKPATWV